MPDKESVSCRCKELRMSIGVPAGMDIIPDTWEAVSSERYPVQSGNDIYSYIYRCRECGSEWNVTEREGNDEPFTIEGYILHDALILKDSGEQSSRGSEAAGPLACFAEKFAGIWIDESGRRLVIRKDGDLLAADFFITSVNPAARSMLHGTSPSLNMKAAIHGEELLVELGENGLGPALKLGFENGNLNSLIPVMMGLYDDYDEDSGVSWILPLSRFIRCVGSIGS